MKKILILAFLAVTLINCNDDTTSSVSLTAEEENDLQFLREEEKLARDVYLYAYDKYALTVFNNISQSEQQHMDKVLTLLNYYNLEDPALANPGEFSNEELQTLYNQLTAQVDISQLEALKVGATIEDLDIKDIEEFESRTDKSNILNVYGNLKCGSRNHMRAYYSALEALGVIYVAQYISQDELDVIIGSTNERCGRQ